MSQSSINNEHTNHQEYLYDLLVRIKERPGMYLGKKSITRLRMLLMGYSMSRAELGLGLTEQEKQFAQFQKWVQQKYNVASTEGWENIILDQVGDEKLALNLFFELFYQFETQKNPLWVAK